MAHMRTLPPAACDVVLRSLETVEPGAPLVHAFVRFLTEQLATHRDFELLQTYLSVFLKVREEERRRRRGRRRRRRWRREHMGWGEVDKGQRFGGEMGHGCPSSPTQPRNPATQPSHVTGSASPTLRSTPPPSAPHPNAEPTPALPPLTPAHAQPPDSKSEPNPALPTLTPAHALLLFPL